MMKLSDRLVRLFSTFFGIGNLPLAPGSMASIAGVLICVLLQSSVLLYGAVFGVITLLGFWSCGRMEALLNEEDPSSVVIDEVSGVMIAFFLLPLTPAVMWTAFFLFRAFDMFKIYPVNKFEEIPGGAGIMMDDVIAGIYTNIVMQIAVRWAGIV